MMGWGENEERRQAFPAQESTLGTKARGHGRVLPQQHRSARKKEPEVGNQHNCGSGNSGRIRHREIIRLFSSLL